MVLAMIDCWQLKKDRMVQVISDPWVRSLQHNLVLAFYKQIQHCSCGKIANGYQLCLNATPMQSLPVVGTSLRETHCGTMSYSARFLSFPAPQSFDVLLKLPLQVLAATLQYTLQLVWLPSVAIMDLPIHIKIPKVQSLCHSEMPKRLLHTPATGKSLREWPTR